MTEITPEKFVFKYNGDLEYIDFDTLYVSQLHFTEFLKSIKSSLYPGGELNIKVKAMPPSSFSIELLLRIKEGAEPLFPYAKTAFESLVGTGAFLAAVREILNLYKWLRGKKPEKEEKKGDTTIIYLDNRTFEINTTIYQAIKDTPEIRHQLSKTFEKVNSDDEVSGIEIIKGDSTIIEVRKEEFQFFDTESVENIAEEIEGTRTQVESNVPLSVFKIVFEKGYIWQFIYKGHKISAQIKDQQFLLDVTSGKIRFASGDVLIADLEIHQKFDLIVNTYINDSFSVLNVTRHIARSEQSRLDF